MRKHIAVIVGLVMILNNYSGFKILEKFICWEHLEQISYSRMNKLSLQGSIHSGLRKKSQRMNPTLKLP